MNYDLLMILLIMLLSSVANVISLYKVDARISKLERKIEDAKNIPVTTIKGSDLILNYERQNKSN